MLSMVKPAAAGCGWDVWPREAVAIRTIEASNIAVTRIGNLAEIGLPILSRSSLDVQGQLRLGVSHQCSLRCLTINEECAQLSGLTAASIQISLRNSSTDSSTSRRIERRRPGPVVSPTCTGTV